MAEMKIDVTKLVGRCCEMVLDETEYAGKTLREWIKILTSEDGKEGCSNCKKIKELSDRLVSIQELRYRSQDKLTISYDYLSRLLVARKECDDLKMFDIIDEWEEKTNSQKLGDENDD